MYRLSIVLFTVFISCSNDNLDTSYATFIQRFQDQFNSLEFNNSIEKFNETVFTEGKIHNSILFLFDDFKKSTAYVDLMEKEGPNLNGELYKEIKNYSYKAEISVLKEYVFLVDELGLVPNNTQGFAEVLLAQKEKINEEMLWKILFFHYSVLYFQSN